MYLNVPCCSVAIGKRKTIFFKNFSRGKLYVGKGLSAGWRIHCASTASALQQERILKRGRAWTTVDSFSCFDFPFSQTIQCKLAVHTLLLFAALRSLFLLHVCVYEHKEVQSISEDTTSFRELYRRAVEKTVHACTTWDNRQHVRSSLQLFCPRVSFAQRDSSPCHESCVHSGEPWYGTFKSR